MMITAAMMIKHAGIQSGASTHHHDQLITFVSFNTIKATARRPKNVMPPPPLLLLFDAFTVI